MVLSYHPAQEFDLPVGFDESVYLLKSAVPPKYAISHTNRLLAECSDYIISGAKLSFGGAYKAIKYAKHLKKNVIEIV